MDPKKSFPVNKQIKFSYFDLNKFINFFQYIWNF